MAKPNIHDIEVGIEVDTDQLEDAIEKADELGSAMARIAPTVSVIRPKGCTINIYTGGLNG